MRNHSYVRRLLAALLALGCLFGLMALTGRERQENTLFENVFSAALYPLQVAADWVTDKVHAISEDVQELMALREQNQQLRSNLERMAQFEPRIEQLQRENETLRHELGIRQKGDYDFLAAEVIGRDTNTWMRTLVINRGSRDGVRSGMAVVNWQGMVGKVLHVNTFSSTVQLLIDPGLGSTPGFAAGAKSVAQELGYVVTQADGTLRMTFAEREPAAKVGEPIFTSGQAVLPGDLLVGWITSIGQEAVQTYATLQPAVDFNRLEVVQVVLTQPVHEPAQEQEGEAP